MSELRNDGGRCVPSAISSSQPAPQAAAENMHTVPNANLMNDSGSLDSTFFLVKHKATSEAGAERWWAAMSTQSAEAELLARENQRSLGLHSHAFLPLDSPKDEVYCVWEVAPDKTVADLFDYLETDTYMAGIQMSTVWSSEINEISNKTLLKVGATPFKRVF